MPLVVTVIVGTKGENVRRDYPTNVRLKPDETGLYIDTIFMGFQIRSLDPDRFTEPAAGKISDENLARVEAVVRYCLGL